MRAPASPPTLMPGDLDKMTWAVSEARDISTRGVIEHAGLPFNRGREALRQLGVQGRVTESIGHHHDMNGDLCQCRVGEAANLPKLTHWHDV